MEGVFQLSAECSPRERFSAGGKGRGLINLIRAGVRVPECFCIEPGAPIDEAVDLVLAGFNDKNGVESYSVRSSASVEDGRERSFAGLFDTFLEVTGRGKITEAVEKCRNSVNSHRVKKYLKKDEVILVSVLVQRMVPADAAGVLFTCEPVSGSINHIVIEAVEGLGDDLAQGKKIPERIILNKDSSDASQMYFNVLNRELAGRLKEESLIIEKKLNEYGIEGPVDMEWAVCGSVVYWLQARPVTSWGRRKIQDEEILFIRPGEIPDISDDEIFLTSMNAREAAPDVVMPLIRDLWVAPITEGFLYSFRILGAEPDPETTKRLLKIIDGRAFLNITAFISIMKKLPLKNPEDMIKSFLIGNVSVKPRFSISPFLMGKLLKLAQRSFSLERDYEEFYTRELQDWKYPPENEIRQLSLKELWMMIEKSSQFKEGFELHINGSAGYLTHYSFIADLCEKYGGDPSSMVQGLGTLLWASSAGAIRDLVYILGENKNRIYDRDMNPLKNWQEIVERDPALVSFRDGFRSFISKYGHLGVEMLDYKPLAWRDRPDTVLKLMANLINGGMTEGREKYQKELEYKREKAIKDLADKLPLHKRIGFKFILGMMHRSAPFRENLKFLLGRRIHIMKSYYLEIGKRMAEVGILSEPMDVYYLEKSEIKGFLMENDLQDRKDRVFQRKSNLAKQSGLPCPLHRIESRFGVKLFFPKTVSHEQNTWQGTGTSAGRAKGSARVILDLADGFRLKPGEILVTSSTDPSWTSLFSIASAIVVEVGGLLSHGAVVAREVGIPAVMGIPGIVQGIKDGQTLLVDGSAGIVTIMKTEEKRE